MLSKLQQDATEKGITYMSDSGSNFPTPPPDRLYLHFPHLDTHYDYVVTVYRNAPDGFIVAQPPVFGAHPICYLAETPEKVADKIWELYCKEKETIEETRNLVVTFEDIVIGKDGSMTSDQITKTDRATILGRLMRSSA